MLLTLLRCMKRRLSYIILIHDHLAGNICKVDKEIVIKTEIQRKPVLCLFFILTKELALQDLAAFHGTEDITFE